MSFNDLSNIMRSQAIAILSTIAQTRVGIICGYDPDTYTASVLIQPENIKAVNLPILTNWIGDEWGFYAAPALNDMVLVHFQEGSFSCGFIGQRLYSLTDKPVKPGPPSDEIWMIHKTGTYIKFLNDGSLEIKTLDSDEEKTNININSNIVVNGNITATGDILDNSGTNSNNIKDMRDIYNSHVHGGVFPGPADTLQTTQTQ